MILFLKYVVHFRQKVSESLKLEKLHIFALGQDLFRQHLSNVVAYHSTSGRSTIVGRLQKQNSCGVAQIGGKLKLSFQIDTFTEKKKENSL